MVDEYFYQDNRTVLIGLPLSQSIGCFTKAQLL